MERHRRACISDKMAALHQLAMNLIGEDSTCIQKTEKVDVLGMCYTIFRNLVTVVKEEPEIHLRVLQLNKQLRDKLGSDEHPPDASSVDEGIDEQSPRPCTSFYPSSQDSLLHITPSGYEFSDPSNSLALINETPTYSLQPTMDSGIGYSLTELDCQNSFTTPLPDFRSTFCPVRIGAIRMPLKHRMRASKSSVYISPNSSRANISTSIVSSNLPKVTVTSCPNISPSIVTQQVRTKSQAVWRPYLD